jgi:hypothetical protein
MSFCLVDKGVRNMSICAEVMRLTLELSFASESEDIKDKWDYITEHASECKTCALALEVFIKGTNTKTRTGALANWDVDPLEFRDKLDASLSGFATQFDKLSYKLEADKSAELKESIEKEAAILPLTKRVHLLLLLLWSSGKRGIVGESIQGIVRIMKLLFLMKMDAGLDKYVVDYYTFAPYKQGPFEKAVYEDLDALVERNLIERKPVEESQLGPESRLPKELEIEESIDFDRVKNNAIYTLTDTGKKYARAFSKGAEQIDPAILRAIKDIKSNWASQPLIHLLKYVYKKYPEYTIKSEIIDKVLGSDE